MRKSKIDHNSLTLFYRGVPVSTSFRSALIAFVHSVTYVLEFLIRWPSSSTR